MGYSAAMSMENLKNQADFTSKIITSLDSSAEANVTFSNPCSQAVERKNFKS